MKKVIFSVLALIFAITLVICGYFLITSLSLQKYAVDEGVPCPYSWKELRSGAYRLEINTAAYPDGNWGVECYPKNVVAAAAVSNSPGTTAFSILPLNAGETYVRVFCEQTTPLTVRVFEIGMQISVSEDLEITVDKTEHIIYDGVTSTGEEEELPFQWWTNPDGLINLLITEEINGSWEAVDYDSDSIEVTGPFYREDSCGFEIRGKAAGIFHLAIHDGACKALLLEVEVTEDLIASIAGFRVDTYTIDRSEEHNALESVVGISVVLPQQALITEYSVKTKSGSIGFLLNDQEWSWQISTNKTVEDLSDDIAAYAAETNTVSQNGVTLTAYSFSDGVAVFWSDGLRSMALNGQRGVSVTDALSVAGQIVEANNG